MTDPLDDATLSPASRASGQARHWVARLASGSATREELDALRAWLAQDAAHAKAFARERALWQDLSQVEGAFSDRAGWPARLVGPRWSVRRRRVKRAVGAAVAASLIAMVAGPQLLVMALADHRSRTGEIQDIRLADGSRVMLDSASAIAVHFDQGERRIDLLAGRAWFDVRHGDARPFRVTARGGVTEDVGTAFEVDRTAEVVDVAVTQGAVRVANRDEGHPGLLLRIGQHGRYGHGGGVERIEGSGPRAIAAWRNGELLLDNVPLDAAIRAIGRYHSGTLFVWGDLSALRAVSGTFRTDRPDDALATLVAMRGLRVSRLPGNILILRAPGEP